MRDDVYIGRIVHALHAENLLAGSIYGVGPAVDTSIACRDRNGEIEAKEKVASLVMKKHAGPHTVRRVCLILKTGFAAGFPVEAR